MGSSKYNGEDPQWLFAQYQNGSNLLLVDCRPLGDYSKAHIEGAINISIPALMLRRLKKGNMALKNFINSKPAVEKYDMRFTAERVVLYDDNSYADSFTENPTLQYLQEKLGEDNFVTILNGGFRCFEELFPHLCQCGNGTELGNAMFSLASMKLQDEIPSPLYRNHSFDSNNNHDNNNNSLKILSDKISDDLNRQNAKDLLFRPDSSGPIEIIPQLYLGNKTDSSVLELLRKANITHILNVTHDLPNCFEDMDGYEYLKLPVQDNWDGNVMDLFPKAFSFIENAIATQGNVLVHCLGGISRSSTIIIAYLMIKCKFNLNDAYDYVKSKKSNIAPNFNFMGQLLDFERSRSEPHTPYSTSPGSISPGQLSVDSGMSTSSVETNSSC